MFRHSSHRVAISVASFGAASIVVASCATTRPVPEQTDVPPSSSPAMLEPEGRKQLPQAVAPKEHLRIPAPDAAAAEVPDGYRVEVAVRDLTYPTSVEEDDVGNLYVAEAGYAYGDLVAPARVLRVSPRGTVSVVADQLNGPVNDVLWHDGRLYISHRGKISVVDEAGAISDLVTDLPSFGDHHTNQLAVGPDGKLYFGQGTATNSGVVGLDNVYPYLWLAFYPDVHDIPARSVELEGATYTTPDALTVLANTGELVRFLQSAKHLVSPAEPLLVRTGAFQPFGRWESRVEGRVKGNGTILRMNPDGTGLETYAWGFRNPFGVRFGPDGRLFVSDLGFDERGSRPIANAPDVLWTVKEDAFYGWPDFAAGIPVTDERLRSTRGEAPRMLLKEPPPVEKPLLTRPPHASPMKFDFSKSADFGFEGQMFIAEFGGGAPVTGPGPQQAGYQVARIDLTSGDVTPFFRLRADRAGPAGYEHSATSGPRHPVEARFSRDGRSLYIVDFGAMVGFPAGAGPAVRPFPGTGVVWRVVRDGRGAGASRPTVSMAPGGVARLGDAR